MIKRGLTYQEAIDYVGVKRRTFDDVWRPQLVAMPQGSCLIFDRHDLDRLFDAFKKAAADPAPAANDDVSDPQHNARRNGRPVTDMKGDPRWAKQRGASTPTKTGPGKSTSGGESLGFAAAASAVLKRQSGG